MKNLSCITYSKVFWGVTARSFVVANIVRLSLAKSSGDSQYHYPKIKEKQSSFQQFL